MCSVNSLLKGAESVLTIGPAPFPESVPRSYLDLVPVIIEIQKATFLVFNLLTKGRVGGF